MGRLKEGILQVYTGNGKGKTTAALGQALRAVGHGFKVYMAQFMKSYGYGEVEAAKRLYPNLVIEQFGRTKHVNKEKPEKIDYGLAKKALLKAKKVLESGEWDIVILDEVNVALNFGLLSLDEVLELLKVKPKNVELIFTGRYAPKEVIDLAELVSEVVEIKHPYRSKGAKPRMGIEY
ncbi:MAG: cob(I)yrinic acid a,c-diamide adenosyltransferase [Candidatus Hecatellales archaeon]|nr:MAG: cob(I)yrinic acid a,c-diamide adenosyltransferase [Candidatus Hecatellales archaeon]